MRRYEIKKQMVRREVLVAEECDGCGVAAADAEFGLFPVAIEVNLGEEGGSRDEYDYCNDCLVERADRLIAAGSRAPFVTGTLGEEPADHE